MTSLVLDGTTITPNDMRTIIHSLRRHPSISSLSLSSCNIDNDCIEYITFLIKSNRNIVSLDLSSNSITSEGLDHIFAAFRSGAGKQIISLDLSYNKLDSISIINLSKALQLNQLPNLKNLILREVGGNYESIEILLNSIQQDSLIETLDISGNSIELNKNKNIKKSSSSLTKDMTKMLTTLTTSKGLKDMSNQVTGLFNQLGNDLSINKKTKRKGKYLALPPTPSSSKKSKQKSTSTTTNNDDDDIVAKKVSKKTAKTIINFVKKSPRLRDLILMKVGLTLPTALQIIKLQKKDNSNTTSKINVILDMNDIDTKTINGIQRALGSP